MYILIAVIFVALITWFMLRTKKKAIIPTENKAIYRQLMIEHVDYYSKLNGKEKLRFEKLIEEFLQEVKIEGVGTEITDLDRVQIASSAVIPIFGLGDWKYKNLTNVILYPDTFDKEFQFEGENRSILGMVGSG